MRDRRQKERISTDLKIIACSPSINPDSRITDISTTGAFISTNSPLPVDAKPAIHVHLPGDPEIIEINARVVWTKATSNATAAGMGIHFTNIAPEHQEKLTAFIEQNT